MTQNGSADYQKNHVMLARNNFYLRGEEEGRVTERDTPVLCLWANAPIWPMGKPAQPSTARRAGCLPPSPPLAAIIYN